MNIWPRCLLLTSSLTFALACSNDFEIAPPERSSGRPPLAEEAQPTVGSKAIASDFCGKRNLPSDVLLDRGHDEVLTIAGISGSRLLTASTRRWILWDSQTHQQIASGDLPGNRNPYANTVAALAGDVAFVTDHDGGIQLLNARDGTALAPSFKPGTEWTAGGFARDGSYAWVLGSDNVITALSVDGTVLAQHAGASQIYGVKSADPGVLRIAGEHAITLIDVSHGTEKVTDAFEGSFETWFADGSHFLTRSESTFHVYTSDGKLVKTLSRPKYARGGGYGPFVWIAGSGVVNVTRFADDQLMLSFPVEGKIDLPPTADIIPSGSSVGFIQGLDHAVTRLELGRAMPAVETRTFPIGMVERYRSDENGHWAVAGADGQVAAVGPEETAMFGCGMVWQVAPSRAGTVAVSTSDGKVRVFDLSSGNKQFLTTLPFASWRVMLSQDGRRLLAEEDTRRPDQQTLHVIALPEGTILHTFEDSWDRTVGGGAPAYTLSDDGERVARVICTRRDSCIGFVTKIDGTPIYQTPVLSDANVRGTPLAFSPSGERLVVGDQLCDGSEKTTPIPGMFVGWLDEDRLLVRHQIEKATLGSPAQYRAAVIDASGKELLTLPTSRNWFSLQVVDSEHVAASNPNVVYRLRDGAPVWQGNPGSRYLTVAGDYAVEQVNDLLVMSRWH